jgi:hypothetical protein
MKKRKKPISEAKLADRASALKSTGPRAPEGKARSKDITALGEDRTLFPATLQSFLDSWNPATEYEASLVEELASLKIRLKRCVRIETGFLDIGIPDFSQSDAHESINAALALSFAGREDAFTKLSRYEAGLSRAYDRTLKQLLAVRKQRLAPNPFFDETKPILVENKQSPPDNEPTEPTEPDLRKDFDPPPADPAEAANRRHGRFTPFPDQSPHTFELLWISEPRNKDLDPHAPAPRTPRG